MDKLRSYALLIVFFASVAFTGTASAYTLSLADASGNPGQTIGLDLLLSLADDEKLNTALFDVNYDGTVLEYTGVTWNDALLEGVYDATPPGPGTPPITFVLFLSSPLSGPLHLATIDFKIIEGTTTIVSLENIDLLYDYLDTSDPENPLPITEILEGELPKNSTINGDNAVVPEPSTMLLCGAGIACLLACRRRKS